MDIVEKSLKKAVEKSHFNKYMGFYKRPIRYLTLQAAPSGLLIDPLKHPLHSESQGGSPKAENQRAVKGLLLQYEG